LWKCAEGLASRPTASRPSVGGTGSSIPLFYPDDCNRLRTSAFAGLVILAFQTDTPEHDL
jgi:hypothetical protein